MTSSINFNLPFDKFQSQINNKFKHLFWNKPNLTNDCLKPLTKASLTLNNSQKFVKEYFNPSNPNGILLYHSVGSGKTMSALLLAQKFQKKGYDVIWVTRTTLKEDINKNLSFINLSKPLLKLSYRQFSNLYNKKGILYNKLVKYKGSKDILNKTLLIIDEAHKLYTKDLKVQEMHNIKNIENLIFNSYDISKSPVKVVLLSATPMVENPLELIKLFNLLIPKKSERFNVQNFESEYLDPKSGKFTKENIGVFKNKIKGLVSYLDLSHDPRRFTQINYHEVMVPISIPPYSLNFKNEIKQCNSNLKLCNKLDIPKQFCTNEYTNCINQVQDNKVDYKKNKYQTKILKDKCNLEII